METERREESKEKHLIPATLVFLNFVAQAGQLAPVPYLLQIASLVSQIAQTAQDVEDNKEAFQELASNADRLVAGLWRSYEFSPNKESWPPPGLKDVLVDLESTLQSIQEYTEQMGKMNAILQGKVDLGKLHEYRRKLALYASKFERHAHIRIDDAVSQIISSQVAAAQTQLDKQTAPRTRHGETRSEENDTGYSPTPSTDLFSGSMFEGTQGVVIRDGTFIACHLADLRTTTTPYPCMGHSSNPRDSPSHTRSPHSHSNILLYYLIAFQTAFLTIQTPSSLPPVPPVHAPSSELAVQHHPPVLIYYHDLPILFSPFVLMYLWRFIFGHH